MRSRTGASITRPPFLPSKPPNTQVSAGEVTSYLTYFLLLAPVARAKRGGKSVTLGAFATAEEAALCVARSARQEAARRHAVAPLMTSEEALQQAQAERLTLRAADTTMGYFGVHLHKPGTPKPYQARQVNRGGKKVTLGSFATAEEAALCVVRSPPAI